MGGGEDAELRPLLPTSRLALCSGNHQPVCPEPNASSHSWVPEKGQRTGGRGNWCKSCPSRGLSFPPASKEAGLSGVKAHLVSMPSSALR